MLFYYFNFRRENQFWYNTKPTIQISIWYQKKSALLEVYKTPKWPILRIRESPFLRLVYDMHRIKCFCFYLCKLFLRLRSQRMLLKSLQKIEMPSGEQTNFIFLINIKRIFYDTLNKLVYIVTQDIVGRCRTCVYILYNKLNIFSSVAQVEGMDKNLTFTYIV